MARKSVSLHRLSLDHADSNPATPSLPGGRSPRRIHRGRQLLVGLVSFLFLVLAIPSVAQAADVWVSGLTITPATGSYVYDASYGWVYNVHYDQIAVLADKAVASVVRVYHDAYGREHRGMGTVAPQNGLCGAIEQDFGGTTTDQKSHLGEWYVFCNRNGYSGPFDWQMWADDTPYGPPGWLSPAADSGWKAYNAGHWRIYYEDGSWEDTTDFGLLFGSALGLSARTPDPVTITTGNATYAASDLVLPGIGLGLAFTRTYNAQDASSDGPLGYGWVDIYATKLLFPSSYQVSAVYPDGHRVLFQAPSGGDYQAPAGVFERLHQNQNGSFTLTFSDQTRFEYTSAGRLSSLVDRYGNTTSLTYNGSSELTEVSDAGGRSLTLAYTGGRITAIEDSDLRSVSYGYEKWPGEIGQPLK